MQGQFVRASSFDEGCTAFLSILGRALAMRTVVLVDGTPETARMFGWSSADAPSEELAAASDLAQTAWLDAEGRKADPQSAWLDTGDGLRMRLDPRQLALPLSVAQGPLLGILQLQRAAAIEGIHRRFALAAANHLALALDRHRASGACSPMCEPRVQGPCSDRRRTARVLVVDGTPDNVSALAMMLADEGFTVETALRPDQALRKARLCEPDVLLLDGEAPGMSGLGLARRLRAEVISLPVILMSWHAEPDIVQELAVEHIAKPLDVDALIAMICRAVA